ncbi:MAG: hypothetical protein UR26_C0002G0078 [candidate division TM6 bacterium GW2011_GWF2_32_72]|nr:MAG: hypothetical protein UR26_C0002G0078 [candidate division TM6 bacterium GW2011_GWF2_32_72]
MKMQKRQFRIGELANRLEVERFVVRFWEKEFGIKSTRSTGRQRFYEERDLEKFIMIKSLLYEKGFTIAGAKKQLKSKFSQVMIASQKTTMETANVTEVVKTPVNKELEQLKNKHKEEVKELSAKIMTLQKELVKVRDLL